MQCVQDVCFGELVTVTEEVGHDFAECTFNYPAP